MSGGTDNHVFLVEIHSRGLTGSDAQPAFDRAGITINKNSIPFDPLPPMKAGGIRMGTPAVTTRGMREPEMEKIAGWIAEILTSLGDANVEQRVRRRSRGPCLRVPSLRRAPRSGRRSPALTLGALAPFGSRNRSDCPNPAQRIAVEQLRPSHFCIPLSYFT